MARLLLQMAEDPSVPHAVRLAAIRDALDRAGITATQTLEVEAVWQTIISDIVTDAPTTAKQLPDRYRPHEVVHDIVHGELVEEADLPGDEVEDGAEVYDYTSGLRIRATRRTDD